MSGDGIYSRRLTRYPGDGRYVLTVHGDDDGGRAFVAKARGAEGEDGDNMASPACCGSTVSLAREQVRNSNILHFILET